MLFTVSDAVATHIEWRLISHAPATFSNRIFRTSSYSGSYWVTSV